MPSISIFKKLSQVTQHTRINLNTRGTRSRNKIKINPAMLDHSVAKNIITMLLYNVISLKANNNFKNNISFCTIFVSHLVLGQPFFVWNYDFVY